MEGGGFEKEKLNVGCADFGWWCGVDFNAVNSVVDATHRYKEIFYTSDE